MAKIKRVDYESMPLQAKEMRAYGKQLNAEVKKAYTSVAEMHDSWYGKRYNELIKSVNNLVPQLNKIITLVVKEIPYALEVIANNYSQADRGANATVVSNEEPDKILHLTLSNDVGMKFITSNVAAIQKSVSVNLTNAKDQMNKIEVVYKKIQWQSDASEAFKIKFTKLKNDIITSFDDINTQFTKLMQQTQQDIENAENANNAN